MRFFNGLSRRGQGHYGLVHRVVGGRIMMLVRAASIAGLLIAFGSVCGWADDEPKRQANSGLPRTVSVNALAYFVGADGRCGGLCHPVHITVDRNPGKRLRIAF